MKVRPDGTIVVSTIITFNRLRWPKAHKAMVEKPLGVPEATWICYLIENGLQETGTPLPKEEEVDLSQMGDEL